MGEENDLNCSLSTKHFKGYFKTFNNIQKCNFYTAAKAQNTFEKIIERVNHLIIPSFGKEGLTRINSNFGK